jgi:AcrR family transcriptional regulator
MKNPKENRSYQNIVQHAGSLFWKHGIRRVSVEEICREACVSKMTFYRLFKNKHEVAQKVLDNVMEEGVVKYRAIMQQQIPFDEKMKQLILLKKESSNDISEEFIKDIYQNDESGLKQQMEAFRTEFKNEIKNDFKNAQQQGWIRSDVKIDFILFMQDHLTNLIMDEKLASMYKNSQEMIMEITKFFFYGILSEGENSK